MDKEIGKIAETIAEKINDISMEETEIIDNCKEIRKLSKIISSNSEKLPILSMVLHISLNTDNSSFVVVFLFPAHILEMYMSIISSFSSFIFISKV